MINRRLGLSVGVLGLGLWLGTATLARSQQQPDVAVPQEAQAPADLQSPQGMDVLTRGPIHEAYAEPVDYQPQPGEVVPKQPPAPIEEVPPDQKPAGENVEWIPGYWSWDDSRNDFIWVSGVWRIAPPGRTWVPGSWSQVQGGWQWTPGFWMAVQQGSAQPTEGENLQYLPAPPAPLEAAPSTPAPNDQAVYIPGTWVYVQTRYAWRPGYWVDYRPGWVWIPAHYIWTPAGYVFVEGYWDFEFGRRGLMFAPVYFTQPLWQTAGWYYQPSYLVYDQFVLTSMFVRPAFYSYYFGDYFDARFRRLGFTPWIDYRVGRYAYDPLWSYYRWAHRGDQAWINNVRNVYAGRLNNTIPRPPITLAQQNTLIRSRNVTNITNVMAVSSLARADRHLVNLQPVAQAERAQYRQTARSFVRAAEQRSQVERRLLTGGQAPIRGAARPQTAPIHVPRSAAATASRPTFQPPPSPAGRVGETPRTREERNANLPRVETNRGREAEPRIEPRAQPRPEAQRLPGTVEPRPQPRPEPRAQPRSEPRPAVERQPERQVQPRPEPRPQPRAEPRPESRPPVEREARPRAEPRPEPRPEPRREGSRPPAA
jgi:WXXGXW repeat (2 copies)